jgi:hypothetical protein
MSPDAIVRIMLILWITALGLLLLRLLWLRLHQTYLLFTISAALDLVFGLASLKYGLLSRSVANLGLLGDTMDLFLTPSIALELFSAPGTFAMYPIRYLSPVLLTVFAGAGINLFLVSGPDSDSLEAAAGLAYIADTMMTIFVLSFVLRKNRTQELLVERNTLWLRRLFTIELIMSAVHSLIAPFIDAKQFNFVDIVFFGLSVIATAACTLALRKTPITSEAA